MAVEHSEKTHFVARDTPLSLCRRDEASTTPSLLSSPSCHASGDLDSNDLKSARSTSRMDEDSKDCFPTGSMSSQPEETITQQLLSRQISSSHAISAYHTVTSNHSAFGPSRDSVENDDTGSSSISLSSSATCHSRGPTASQSSEISLQEDDLSSSFVPLATGVDARPSQPSSAAGKISNKSNFSTSGRIGATDAQTERRPSSVGSERNAWPTFRESVASSPIDCPRLSNAAQLLYEWNESPFVSSFSSHNPIEESDERPLEKRSSLGLPWHIDLDQVVTGDMVATGSFGMVFKGIYREEKVAIKVLLLPEAFSKKELDKLKDDFLKEIDLWNNLSHPNVVQFIGATVLPPRWAIVTEFLDGGSLRSFLSRQGRTKLPQTTIHAMALDIARGMEYLHQNSIMHRDLKSANLLLSENGTVKVADFGLARMEATDDRDNLTAETGTIRWMAPEVICHRSYTRKIDVYSYGIVLWELCTSCLPFEGMSFVQLAHAVAHQHHRPPTADIPSPYVRLMRQCWDKDSTKRPDFAVIVEYLEKGFLDDFKAAPISGYKKTRSEIKSPVDNYLRPTLSMRGGRVLGRSQTMAPSYVANTDDVLSDDDYWVSASRQCRCTIM